MYRNTATLALLCSSLTVTGSMLAGSALAQGPAPLPELVLEEVVVTATKVAESIQDIPSTITAVGGEALDEFQIRDFSDVTSLAPGLSLDSINPTNPTVALLGVSFDPQSNARASVETYWNEMPIATQAIFQQMFDLARIEVLRGPQGTLQGRTSPAGAILVNTRLPSFDEIEATIQQTVSDNDGYNTQVGLGIPISDSLAVRIAGVHDSNELEGIEHVKTGTDQSGHTNAGRISVVWEPTDTFSATLISEYLESYKDGFEDVVNITGGSPQTFDREAIHDGLSPIEQRNKLNVLRMRLDLPGHE
ncbi:MAG: TonB-dependent receptor plug domain-containing protein, partial [Pseudomonadales bacterium]